MLLSFTEILAAQPPFDEPQFVERHLVKVFYVERHFIASQFVELSTVETVEFVEIAAIFSGSRPSTIFPFRYNRFLRRKLNF
jgi:hypothetical protein